MIFGFVVLYIIQIYVNFEIFYKKAKNFYRENF